MFGRLLAESLNAFKKEGGTSSLLAGTAQRTGQPTEGEQSKVRSDL